MCIILKEKIKEQADIAAAVIPVVCADGILSGVRGSRSIANEVLPRPKDVYAGSTESLSIKDTGYPRLHFYGSASLPFLSAFSSALFLFLFLFLTLYSSLYTLYSLLRYSTADLFVVYSSFTLNYLFEN